MPAFLSRDDQDLRLLISTERKGEVVMVMVEEIEVVEAADDIASETPKSA